MSKLYFFSVNLLLVKSQSTNAEKDRDLPRQSKLYFFGSCLIATSS